MTVLLRKVFTWSGPCRFEARTSIPVSALAPHYVGRVLELSHGAQPPPGV